MQYLKVQNLTKSYTTKTLIKNVNFTIQKNQKIAIIAKNGAGKSTFLKLLMHQLDFADGEIEWRKNLDIRYLSQECTFEKNKTVREILFDFEKDIEREKEVELQIIINKLKIDSYIDQHIHTLSWGETKRVMLAKVLTGSPDMLILDEPTNHLDLDMIEWLERYLKKQHTTVLMVTHDRYFLERVCTHIIELDRGTLYEYPGNYSYFLQKKAEREEHEQIWLHKLKQLYKKELARIKTSPQGRQTKSNFRSKRQYTIEDQYETKKILNTQDKKTLILHSEKRHLWGKILKLKNIKKSFWKKIIVEHFSHECRHGERIGIIGKNGVGKSTFINILIGEEPIDSGLIQTGETVEFGHYQQKDIHFPEDKRLIDIVTDAKLLEQFLFPPQQQHQFAKDLSGGEKRRLHLLTILQKNPNFLILDEPTNDFDLITLWVLEEFLLQYNGCLLVVSHDRYFMDKIIDHIFVFEGDGKIKDFRWSYTEYKKTEEDTKEEKNKQKKSSITQQIQQAQKKQTKLWYMEQRELEQLGKDIEELEQKKEEINRFFDDKTLAFDDIKILSEELGEIIRTLEIKENRWFELIAKE